MTGSEITNRCNEAESKALGSKLDSLNQKWKKIIADLNELKEKVVQEKGSCGAQLDEVSGAKEASAFEKFNAKVREHGEWLSKCEGLVGREASKTDEIEAERLVFEMNELESDLPYRQTMFEADFRKLYSGLKGAAECDSADRHFSQIMSRYSQVSHFFDDFDI